MAIEIVSFPIKNGDFPWFFVCLPEGMDLPVSNRASKPQWITTWWFNYGSSQNGNPKWHKSPWWPSSNMAIRYLTFHHATCKPQDQKMVNSSKNRSLEPKIPRPCGFLIQSDFTAHSLEFRQANGVMFFMFFIQSMSVVGANFTGRPLFRFKKKNIVFVPQKMDVSVSFLRKKTSKIRCF